MTKPKPKPTKIPPPTPHTPMPLGREIKQLRHLIRQTHHLMDTGTIDFIKGSTLLTRLTHALARIYLLHYQLIHQHLTQSHTDQTRHQINSQLEHILIELGLGPPDS